MLLAAQTIQVNQQNRTIAITTSDDAPALADVAQIQIGFQSYGKAQDALYASAANTSNAILKALTAAGMPKKAIVSTGQGLRPLMANTDNDKARLRSSARPRSPSHHGASSARLPFTPCLPSSKPRRTIACTLDGMPMTLALVLFELVVMVGAISLHDCAQAWAASRLGDPTARLLGRQTMNPVPHFDFFGMALWPLIYVWRSPLILGWGKPIPMTTRNFRHPKDELKATLAGPVAQFAAALVCLLLLLVVKHANPAAGSVLVIADALSLRELDFVPGGLPPIFPVLLFLYFGILVNLLLCVFNLIPLPFLDGGKILVYYLPYNAAKAYESWGIWLMFGFMFFGFGLVLAVFLPVLNWFDRLLYLL